MIRYWTKVSITIAVVLVAVLVVAPAAAAPRNVADGGIIYVGEENLNLSAVFKSTAPVPSGTLVYSPGETNQKSMRVGNAGSFNLHSTNVGGATGLWYAFNGTDSGGIPASAGNVYVEAPSSNLGVVLSGTTASVDGKSVTRGQSISFQLTNNLDGITGAKMKIEITTPGGGTMTTFEGVDLSNLAVTDRNSPIISLANAATGTYTARGVLKGVDKVSGSAGFDTNTVIFEVTSGELAITSNKDTVVRNNPFTVTVTGESKALYNVSVLGIGADRPMIVDGQTAVRTLYDAHSARIMTSVGGKASIEFNTTRADTKTYTIVVRDLLGDLSDDVKVKVEAGSVTITTSGTGTYYIGEEITLSGTNTESDRVYLFMTGPNLPSNGANLANLGSVTSGNPGTFTITNVRADDTWSIRWSTAGLPLDAGSYTIYAVSEPADKDGLFDVRYATASIQLRSPILTATTSSATVAKGDKLTISGIATGNPDNVGIWIFGENHPRLQQFSPVQSDSSFEYRFTPEDIANLPTGQYFVVVQHPFDDVFDVWASGTMLMGNGIEPVDLADLSAAESANALIDALDSPNVNDIYRRLTFIIEDPWIRIDPIGNQTAGSAFTISGTTNLAAGNTLGILGRGDTATAVMQAGVPVPTPPPVPGGSSGAGFGGIATVVKKGTGANTWSFDFGVFNLRPGHYTVTVESIETGAFQTAVFDVLEGHEPLSHALTLSSGWNFVSVPRPLATGSDTAAIFAGVKTDGCSVLRYDTATGQWLALAAADRIGPLEGFWIYSNETATVPLNVSTALPAPPAERSLSTGWNAVGTVTGTTPPSARDAFLSVGGQWTTLIGFDARTQAFETAIVNGGSGAYTDSRQVYPGKGYWLYMTGSGTLCAVGA